MNVTRRVTIFAPPHSQKFYVYYLQGGLNLRIWKQNIILRHLNSPAKKLLSSSPRPLKPWFKFPSLFCVLLHLEQGPYKFLSLCVLFFSVGTGTPCVCLVAVQLGGISPPTLVPWGSIQGDRRTITGQRRIVIIVMSWALDREDGEERLILTVYTLT